MRMAAKKDGSDMPRVERTRVRRSIQLSLWRAETMPRSTPNSNAKVSATTASRAVWGKAEEMMSDTLRLV